MHTPGTSSEINKEWVQFILNQYESPLNTGHTDFYKVNVKRFDCTSATKPGESFNAELVRLDVETTVTKNGGPTEIQSGDGEKKEYNLIVKFLSRDPFNREYIKKVGYHIKEFYMYSEVCKELNNFQESKTGNKYPIEIPSYVYGKCTSKDYVLVMENIKSFGYEVNPKEKGLDLQQIKIAIEHIARLHAISYSYDKVNNFLRKFPCYKFSSTISAFFKPVVYASLENTINFLKTKDEYKEIVKKLELGQRSLPVKFNAMWDDISRHKLLCLTHGDFWNSNLMFLYGSMMEDNTPSLESLRIIDWQISQWNSPIMDLHYLLGTSTNRTLRSAHTDEILRHYHTCFNLITKELGHPVPNWEYEEFRVEFDRLSLVGFLMGMCLIQGTLSKAGELINKQETRVRQNSCSNGLSCFVAECKSIAAKVVIPLAVQPSFNFIIKNSVRKLLEPIASELISEENQVMNTRLLDLIMEAENKGLLDVLTL